MRKKKDIFSGHGHGLLDKILRAVDALMVDGGLLMALVKTVTAVMVDAKQRIVFHTPDFLEIMGYEPDEEIIRKPLSSFLPSGKEDIRLPLLVDFEATSTEICMVPFKKKDDSCALCSVKARRFSGGFVLLHLTNLEGILKDGLTGVASRQSFMLVGEQYLKIAHRLGKKVVVFFIDIDGLKEINEALSHIGGDEAIKLTADAVRSVFRRDTDFVARYGGDELVALTMDPGSDPGKIVADIKAAVARYKVGGKGQSGGVRLSATVTFVEFDPASTELPTLDQLIGRASEELVAQKADRKKMQNEKRKQKDVLAFLGEVSRDDLAKFLEKKGGKKEKK